MARWRRPPPILAVRMYHGSMGEFDERGPMRRARAARNADPCLLTPDSPARPSPFCPAPADPFTVPSPPPNPQPHFMACSTRSPSPMRMTTPQRPGCRLNVLLKRSASLKRRPEKPPPLLGPGVALGFARSSPRSASSASSVFLLPLGLHPKTLWGPWSCKSPGSPHPPQAAWPRPHTSLNKGGVACTHPQGPISHWPPACP